MSCEYIERNGARIEEVNRENLVDDRGHVLRREERFL